MVNYSKLYSLDEETIQIVDSIPKNKRSEFVRESIKEAHNRKINQKEPIEEVKRQQFQIKEVKLG